MSRKKHTKGPWWINEDAKTPFVYDESSHVVARVEVQANGNEQDANQLLIAAAPELLTACKALLPKGWDKGHMDHMDGIKAARLAIAKAEGRGDPEAALDSQS